MTTIPPRVETIIKLSVEANFISIEMVYKLALKYQYEWNRLASHLCLTAFQHRHKNRDMYHKIIKESEQYWKEGRGWV